LIDSILGFSFKPPLREPFEKPILAFKETKTPILSVDIPSGWDVEGGNL
jgi:NAD(P)H-hydrate epimerase